VEEHQVGAASDGEPVVATAEDSRRRGRDHVERRRAAPGRLDGPIPGV
jgi:hypothetical protein